MLSRIRNFHHFLKMILRLGFIIELTSSTVNQGMAQEVEDEDEDERGSVRAKNTRKCREINLWVPRAPGRAKFKHKIFKRKYSKRPS